MDECFGVAVRSAVEEISARDGSYLRQFGVRLPKDPRRGTGANGQLGADTVKMLGTLGIAAACDEAANPSPLSELFTSNARDAVAVHGGRLYQPFDLSAMESAQATLTRGYQEKSVGKNGRYWIRHIGKQPLVLINALGIPLQTWTKFLGDTGHHLRLCVVEPDCCDLLAGGMRVPGSLQGDVERIEEVMAVEKLRNVMVLGWSNAARIAVHLAVRCAERIGQIVLLSPTFQACPSGPPIATAFETQIHKVFRSVLAQPASAQRFSALLTGTVRIPDWEKYAHDRVLRESLLMQLPAQRSSHDFAAPFGSGESLLNYARRVTDDEGSRTEAALCALRQPILLITGQFDQLVCNEHTRHVLRASGANYVEAEVSCAGHYVQELQYPIFRYLLGSYDAGQMVIGASARVSSSITKPHPGRR